MRLCCIKNHSGIWLKLKIPQLFLILQANFYGCFVKYIVYIYKMFTFLQKKCIIYPTNLFVVCLKDDYCIQVICKYNRFAICV